jgi:REP element-mobilizing transposase RayT
MEPDFRVAVQWEEGEGMARAPRPLGSGVTYHVAARGNNGQGIYAGDADKRRFLRLLGSIAMRRGWSLAGYCLMGNHFHLLVTTSEANLSDGMRDLLSRYSRYFNRRRGRTGHLFSPRFLSVVVDRDEQLLVVARYIARNPVRAGLCQSALDWEWSSYRRMVRRDVLPDWIEVGVLLGQFHFDHEQAMAPLIEFFEDGGLDTQDDATVDERVTFARRPSIRMLRLVLPQNETVIAAAGLGFPHREIADALEISRSAVSQRLYRARARKDARTGAPGRPVTLRERTRR